jgi:hypothetical protein
LSGYVLFYFILLMRPQYWVMRGGFLETGWPLFLLVMLRLEVWQLNRQSRDVACLVSSAKKEGMTMPTANSSSLPTPSLPDLSLPLSTYPLEKLLSLWRNGDLTVEQLAGHLLQHVTTQEKRILELERANKRPNLPATDADRPKQ